MIRFRRFQGLFTIVILLYGFTPNLVAQTSNPSHAEIFKQDLKESGNDVLQYFTQPLRWDGTDWLRFGGVAVITGAAMPFDKRVRTEMQNWRKPSNATIFDFGRWAGQGEPTIVLGGLLYGVGLFGNHQNIRITGRLLFEAMLTAGTTSTLLKSVFGRHRPFLNEGPDKYSPLTIKNKFASLPSGHSTVGWLTAGVLAKRADNTYLKILCYTGASIISISRIYHDRHWLSDVILGGFVGYSAADFVVSRQAHREKEKTGGNYSLNVTAPPQISFTYWF